MRDSGTLRTLPWEVVQGAADRQSFQVHMEEEQFQQAPHFEKDGLDHGAGHSLLLLCDAKTPRDKKSKEFKALGHYLCKASIGLL